MQKTFYKFIPGLVIIVLFYTLAVVLWKVKDYPFFLANFIILGTLLGLGFGLWPIIKKDGIMPLENHRPFFILFALSTIPCTLLARFS